MSVHAAVLLTHVAAGVTGLLVAWPALLAPKRRGVHTVLGRVYAGALVVMTVTALALAAADPGRLAGLAGVAVATLAAGLAGVWFARRKPRVDRRGWMVWHLNLMCGSVISFVTAFAVTMTDGFWLAWVVPTLVGSPLIARTTARVAARTRTTPRTVAVPG
jgi:hypothetical protein